MRRSVLALSRFQPYSMAVQTRFKWRHKETDRWRRLMDATCFPVDWLGQTRGPNLSQYSGHWTHLLTCAHVICPWDYPNYYPTHGPTRFVSRITLGDTMTQVRLVSLQGNAVFKHFTSNQHVYVHSNPRLDLCVLHPEQNLKRSGEMKMLWMQNEGMVIRPRLELLEPLREGDHVWIYGMSAHESLFDEEKGPEPLMIPTGVRARVHKLTREHFFLDTSLEGGDKAKIHMGMCGSVVMRNGRCVGMLTATVHEESPTRELAGTAMCTYSRDIFEFLLEVEKQMKNPRPAQFAHETPFEQRRREEAEAAGAAPPKEFRDWELDQSRIARHIPTPVSLWHMEESWMTEEDFMTSTVFGRSGVFNQETQESALGYDMSSSKTGGERPGDAVSFSNAPGAAEGKPFMQGQRKDHSPTGVYADPEEFKQKDVWDYEMAGEMRSLFDKGADDKDAASLNAMRQSLENIRAQRAMERMKETAMKHPGARPSAAADPLHGRDHSGHFGGGGDGGADSFNPDYAFAGGEGGRHAGDFAQHGGGGGGDGGGVPESHPYRQRQAPPGQRPPGPAGTVPPLNESPTQRKKRERREAEAKYQEELRRRHGHKAIPFADEDLAGMWERETQK